MKIQLALDRLSIEEAIAVADSVKPYVDWIEVGTSLIKEFGMNSVRAVREAFPEKTIVADMKTFDNAVYEMEMCFKAGADVATVMGAAPYVTIEACQATALKYQKQIMIDLLNTSTVQMDKLASFHQAIFCAHLSKDQQELLGKATEFEFSAIAGAPNQLALAGGITLGTLNALKKLQPFVVIIGSAITKAEDPFLVAKSVYEMVKK
jgi:3-hexulose-6-phosphate synthase